MSTNSTPLNLSNSKASWNGVRSLPFRPRTWGTRALLRCQLCTSIHIASVGPFEDVSR